MINIEFELECCESVLEFLEADESEWVSQNRSFNTPLMSKMLNNLNKYENHNRDVYPSMISFTILMNKKYKIYPEEFLFHNN